MTKHEQLIRTAIDDYLAKGGDPDFIVLARAEAKCSHGHPIKLRGSVA